MGYYKKVLMLAEEGNRDAVLQVAEMYRERKQYKQAINWYSKIGKTKEVEELNELIINNNTYEDDIF